MNFTSDKILHYRKCFNWARKGIVIGSWTSFILFIAGRLDWWLLLIPFIGAILILIAGAAKEIIYDKLLGKGCAEWEDYKANLIGVADGLMFWKKRKY